MTELTAASDLSMKKYCPFASSNYYYLTNGQNVTKPMHLDVICIAQNKASLTALLPANKKMN